jgi:hypothetical protein
MSRLDQAKERLEQAVGRLDRALERIDKRGQERQALARSLEEARAEGKMLKEASAMVTTRLDSVIGRLKAALDA